MKAISSPCATTIRSHRTRTSGRASCDAAQPAITTAWAWWGIMPAMNSASAALYGALTRSGRGGGSAFAAGCWAAARRASDMATNASAISCRFVVFMMVSASRGIVYPSERSRWSRIGATRRGLGAEARGRQLDGLIPEPPQDPLAQLASDLPLLERNGLHPHFHQHRPVRQCFDAQHLQRFEDQGAESIVRLQ